MCFVVEKQDDSCLWHKKFGHLNYPTLYEYTSNGRIIGLPKLTKHLKICSDYLITKRLKGLSQAKLESKKKCFKVHSFRCLWSTKSKISLPSLVFSKFY